MEKLLVYRACGNSTENFPSWDLRYCDNIYPASRFIQTRSLHSAKAGKRYANHENGLGLVPLISYLISVHRGRYRGCNICGKNNSGISMSDYPARIWAGGKRQQRNSEILPPCWRRRHLQCRSHRRPFYSITSIHHALDSLPNTQRYLSRYPHIRVY